MNAIQTPLLQDPDVDVSAGHGGGPTVAGDDSGERASRLLTAGEHGAVRGGLGASDGPARHNDVAARAAPTLDKS